MLGTIIPLAMDIIMRKTYRTSPSQIFLHKLSLTEIADKKTVEKEAVESNGDNHIFLNLLKAITITK